MADADYCSGGGHAVPWGAITRAGMLRCPVCNRRLHFRSNPDSCALPCVNPSVPRHKVRAHQTKQPKRQTRVKTEKKPRRKARNAIRVQRGRR